MQKSVSSSLPRLSLKPPRASKTSRRTDMFAPISCVRGAAVAGRPRSQPTVQLNSSGNQRGLAACQSGSIRPPTPSTAGSANGCASCSIQSGAARASSSRKATTAALVACVPLCGRRPGRPAARWGDDRDGSLEVGGRALQQRRIVVDGDDDLARRDGLLERERPARGRSSAPARRRRSPPRRPVATGRKLGALPAGTPNERPIRMPAPSPAPGRRGCRGRARAPAADGWRGARHGRARRERRRGRSRRRRPPGSARSGKDRRRRGPR